MTRKDSVFPIIKFRKGETIFLKGDSGDKAFLVKSGVVCVYRMVKGEKIILAHLKAGQILGETAIITGEPRSASAEAAAICQLVTMSAVQIEKALEDGLPFIRALLDQIFFRYRDMEQKHLKRTKNMSASLKKIRLLLDESKKNNAVPKDIEKLLENMDKITQQALKKEKYISLVPRGYMRF